MEKYYIVKYKGNFAYMKPYQASRDSYILSNRYVSFSSLAGIEISIFGDFKNRILKSRLNYDWVVDLQETTRVVDYNNKKYIKGQDGVIERGVLLNPILYLVFNNKDDADFAYEHHVLLSRNEDILFPIGVEVVEKNVFDDINTDEYAGYELEKSNENDGDYFGLNRYTNEPEFDIIKIFGVINMIKYNSNINKKDNKDDSNE